MCIYRYSFVLLFVLLLVVLFSPDVDVDTQLTLMAYMQYCSKKKKIRIIICDALISYPCLHLLLLYVCVHRYIYFFFVVVVVVWLSCFCLAIQALSFVPSLFCQYAHMAHIWTVQAQVQYQT